MRLYAELSVQSHACMPIWSFGLLRFRSCLTSVFVSFSFVVLCLDLLVCAFVMSVRVCVVVVALFAGLVTHLPLYLPVFEFVYLGVTLRACLFVNCASVCGPVRFVSVTCASVCSRVYVHFLVSCASVGLLCADASLVVSFCDAARHPCTRCFTWQNRFHCALPTCACEGLCAWG